ncbi:MAG: hypothetical protein FWD79_05350 [Desulfobulbus sp.]|nr:hypothetical protein [Desulfobulbus sp.]
MSRSYGYYGGGRYYGGGPRPYSYGYGRYGYYGGHRGWGPSAWLWGLGGLVLGSAIVATAMQPPVQQVVYADSPPPVYSYQPRVSPGMCRWERYVLDGYGRTMFDRYGQPVKEYTTGPCGYQPGW